MSIFLPSAFSIICRRIYDEYTEIPSFLERSLTVILLSCTLDILIKLLIKQIKELTKTETFIRKSVKTGKNKMVKTKTLRPVPKYLNTNGDISKNRTENNVYATNFLFPANLSDR